MKYRVLINPDEDGIFVAEVPSLPGCISQWNDRAEVLTNVKEAIAGYIRKPQSAWGAGASADQRGGRGNRLVSRLPQVSGRGVVNMLRKVGYGLDRSSAGAT